MIRLLPGSPPEPDPSSLHAPWLEEQVNNFAYNYLWEPEGLLFWEDLPHCTTEDVEYLPHLVLRPGRRCCSSGDYIPLEYILETVVSKKGHKQGGVDDDEEETNKEEKDTAMARDCPALYALSQRMDGRPLPAGSSDDPLEVEQPDFEQ